MEVKFHVFLSAALREDGWSVSASCYVSHADLWSGGYLGSIGCLDVMTDR
jgi:hypothetical protein